MRMQSKEKELLPGSEEPSIRIANPLSRLQVSLIQESLRETGWKHSDKFVGTVTPGGIRPTFKMTVFQAKAGLKRSEVVQRIQSIVGKFKEEQLEMMKIPAGKIKASKQTSMRAAAK
jgi:hypothetical protein